MKTSFCNTYWVCHKRALKFFITFNIILLLSVSTVLQSFAANTNHTYTSLNRLIVNYNKLLHEQPGIPDNIPVRGKVTDSRGYSLAGVSVMEKGTTNGTVTDINGNYRLTVASEKSVITFRYVGFATQDLDVGNKTTVNVSLIEANAQLNDVVVVAYGTQKKASVTGAISTVKGSELAQAPVDNITNSIAGRVSGVVARQTGGGQPGNDNTTFSIRGINTISGAGNGPLIVVDGIIRNNLNQIDPNSIESVTILKDAAAVAPYGLGGANGVVLITTKSGRTGAPVLSINAFYGVQRPTYYPKVLGPVDYMNLRNEAYFNENPGGTKQPYQQTDIDSYLANNATNPDRYPIADGRSLVNFRAPEQSYNAEVSGGSDRVKYYTNLGYFKQDGMFKPITYTRYSYNIGLDANVTSTTRFTISIKGSFETNTNLDAATNAPTFFRDLYKLIPVDPLQFSNGYAGSSAGLSVKGILNSDGYNRSYNNTMLSTIGLEQKLPIKGLSIKGTFSYDPNSNDQKQWHVPFYYYTVNYNTTPYTYTKAISTAEGPPAYTYLAQSFTKNQTFTYQGYLNYHNTFGKHDITGLAVAEFRNNTSANFNARINNYALNVDEFNFGSSNKNDYTIGGTSSTGSQIGYVYRVGDTYAGKYTIEASGRYDGHYYFAPGKQYAFFPAFSANWIISQENFMKKLTFIDILKLRGSWGKAGALASGPFQYLNSYPVTANNYAFGNATLVQGTTFSTQPNYNITWETSAKTDVGFDATFFKGLINFSVDAYLQKRSGMLIPPTTTVPVEYGVALPQVNYGRMEGRGIEFSLGTQHQFANGLRLGLNGTFSYNNNKLTEINETAATFNNPNRRQTGRPYGTQFGYHALGLFQKSDDKNGDGIINGLDGYNVTQFGTLHPGDIKYADTNGDGKIDANDQVPIGNSPFPLIDYGLNLTAAWKGFDISLFFQGIGKSTVGTQTFLTIPFASNNSNAGYEYFNDHWSQNNPGGKYPIANQAPSSNNTQASDFWQRSGNYVRLKTAQLGYTIPTKVLQTLHIRTLRLYMSAQNLFTISSLKFIDPEIGNPVTGSAVGGAGTSPETLYPIQRVITAGLNATF